MTLPQTPDWIAVDWGTSNLRVWAMSRDGQMLAEATSDKGMGSLTKEEFEPALLHLIDQWVDTSRTVLACGMVGSRQGWAEAPYTAAPCPALPGDLISVVTSDPKLSVHIVPGVKQSDPADVMRGEETQISGFLARNPNWDGVICLPGTHTKWVHVSADEIVSFQTFMTGELFETLTKQTVLRHTIATEGWDKTAFEHGVDEAISRPEKLAARLFSLRAETLLNDLDPTVARSRLSGLLIGAELAASKPYWLGQQVAVIGGADLSSAYVAALAAQGVPATQVNARSATLAGLTAAYQRLKG